MSLPRTDGWKGDVMCDAVGVLFTRACYGAHLRLQVSGVGALRSTYVVM